MDLRQLAALVAVADHGTFSAAADALHTVQSNVSTHVARLEKELGATLVDRSAGRLTEEGMAVVERARRVSAEIDAAVADVAALQSDVVGAVRLGVIGTTGRWLVPRLISTLTEEHPGIDLTVIDSTTATLEPQLVAGRLDLAVVTLPLPSPELVSDRLFDEDLLLVLPDDHPLADRPEVELTDLAGIGLLLPAAGTTFRVELDTAAAAAGVTLTAKAQLDGVRLLASLTFEGWAPGIVPASAIPVWLTGRWRAVRVAGLGRRRIGLARRTKGLPSAPAKATAAVLGRVVTQGIGVQPGLHSPS